MSKTTLFKCLSYIFFFFFFVVFFFLFFFFFFPLTLHSTLLYVHVTYGLRFIGNPHTSPFGDDSNYIFWARARGRSGKSFPLYLLSRRLSCTVRENFFIEFVFLAADKTRVSETRGGRGDGGTGGVLCNAGEERGREQTAPTARLCPIRRITPVLGFTAVLPVFGRGTNGHRSPRSSRHRGFS